MGRISLLPLFIEAINGLHYDHLSLPVKSAAAESKGQERAGRFRFFLQCKGLLRWEQALAGAFYRGKNGIALQAAISDNVETFLVGKS